MRCHDPVVPPRADALQELAAPLDAEAEEDGRGEAVVQPLDLHHEAVHLCGRVLVRDLHARTRTW